MTAFAIGWSGGEMTILELVWFNKSPLLFFLISLLAAVGLRKRNSMGIICGYTVPLAFMAAIVLFEITLLSYSLKQENYTSSLVYSISKLIIWMVIPVMIIIGVTKLKNENQNFGLLNYLITGSLILLLSFSSVIMFTF